jgi:hypothetical protein
MSTSLLTALGSSGFTTRSKFYGKIALEKTLPIKRYTKL